MLAFLKRWRQAYLEDKGNRLHAEFESKKNELCQDAIDCATASQVFNTMSRAKDTIDFDEIHRESVKLFPSSDEHRNMW